MKPDKLREQLRDGNNNSKPKYIYINPTGANPTGTVLPQDRRQEIYNLAAEHDLLILEDDPYFYLQFEDVRPPSFLSMDTDGRVLRLKT